MGRATELFDYLLEKNPNYDLYTHMSINSNLKSLRKEYRKKVAKQKLDDLFGH